MSLILTGNSSTLTVDSNNGIGLGAGTIAFPNSTIQASASVSLQTVFASTTSGVSSTTQNSWFDTNLTASITPKFSTSKILIIVAQQIDINASGNDGQGDVQLLRGSTAITGQGYNYDQLRNYTPGGTGGFFSWSYPIIYLDSPATTSTTTYKTQASLRTAGTLTAQKNNNYSYMILMEIAV